jgi:hypothetical protein
VLGRHPVSPGQGLAACRLLQVVTEHYVTQGHELQRGRLLRGSPVSADCSRLHGSTRGMGCEVRRHHFVTAAERGEGEMVMSAALVVAGTRTTRIACGHFTLGYAHPGASTRACAVESLAQETRGVREHADAAMCCQK